MKFGYKGDVEVLTLRKTRVTKERVKESAEEIDVYSWEVVPVRLDQIRMVTSLPTGLCLKYLLRERVEISCTPAKQSG